MEAVATPEMETSEVSATPTPARPAWRSRLAAVAVALGVALLAFWLFTRHNDFPVNYHPDEGSKVEQLLDPQRGRNFNHPLLMLETAELAQRAFGVPDDERAALLLGRRVSAALAAVAVAALAGVGYVLYGWRGLLVCGFTMALCPPLLVYAHYFKEDTALIAGMAVALLGACLVIRARGMATILVACLVMGIGCAAGMGGKYVGAAMLLPCLFALLIRASSRWWHDALYTLLFLVVTAVGVVVINAAAFESLLPPVLHAQANYRIRAEFEHGTTGQRDLGLITPNLYAAKVALSELMPHQTLFIVAGIAVLLLAGPHVRRTQRGRPETVLAVTMLTWLIVLSFNSIPFPRYALPITISLYLVGAALAAHAISLLARAREDGGTPGDARAAGSAWMHHGALAAVLCVIVLFQGWRCLNFNHQFLADSRHELRQQIAAQVPADARIVADGYTDLGRAGDPWRHPEQPRLMQRIDARMFAADAAWSIDELAATGVTHVAVAAPSYERFFVPGVRALAGQDETLLRRRRFYAELFQRGELLWHSVPQPPTHGHVNPSLHLYRLPAAAPAHTEFVPRARPRHNLRAYNQSRDSRP